MPSCHLAKKSAGDFKRQRIESLLPLLFHCPEHFQGCQSHTHNFYTQILDQDHHILPALLVHFPEHYYLSHNHRILDHIPPAERGLKKKQGKWASMFNVTPCTPMTAKTKTNKIVKEGIFGFITKSFKV